MTNNWAIAVFTYPQFVTEFIVWLKQVQPRFIPCDNSQCLSGA
jgi:hypothetical protein